MMENKFLKFLKLDGLVDSLKGYIDAKLQMLKIDLEEKVSGIIASLFFVVLLAFCFIMMLIFLSLALGNYLNAIFNNSYLGFAVLGLFYLILVIILALNITRKGFLHKKVKNLMLNIMASKKK
jgi:hypothetical protein